MSEHLTEASTPLSVPIGARQTVTDLIRERLLRAPDYPAFRVQSEVAADELKIVTTSDFVKLTASVAKGMVTSGVKPGDRIAIQGATGYPWAVADIAALWVGAIVVPLFDTASAEQVSFIVRDAGISFALAASEEQRSRLSDLIPENQDEPSAVATVFSLDTTGLNRLVALGGEVSDSELEARRTAPRLDDTATLVYTSGTEGRPKGIRITHRNLIGQVLNIGDEYREVVRSGGSTLIFLPLAHVLARALQLMCLAQGMTISYESEPSRAVAALSQVNPTFLVVVPRVLQKIRERITANAEQKHLGGLWRKAESTAVEYGRHLQAAQKDSGLKASTGLRLRRALFDRLFFARIRALLGGNIEYMLSGAAPLSEELGLFYRGIGVEVIEGYGLTETTAPLTGNRPGDNYCGTVGRPSPGHTVRIAADGEVLARGVGVSPGYWNEADNERSYQDGYLRTGDLGTLDSDGRLTITGRVKEVIVTSGGKTISPQMWQQDVEVDPLVAHAVMVGDSRPYPAALIFADREALVSLGVASSVDDRDSTQDGDAPRTVTAPLVLERVAELLRQANLRVSAPERVKRFAVWTADLSPGGDFVTPTMKLRRAQVLEAMEASVEDIYVRGEAV